MDLNKTLIWSMILLLVILNPFVDLFTYTMLIFVVFTWPVMKYPVQIAPVLCIWTLNCLISPNDSDLMGECHFIRGG